MLRVDGTGVVNGCELRVIGMSRSGNHAVINWVLRQAPGRWCWLNCTEPRYAPFWCTRAFDDGSFHRVNYGGFDLGEEKLGRFSRRDWLVYSHEDVFLRVACSGEHEANHDAWVGRSARRRDVLVVRDPFNLFASRLRSFGEGGATAVHARIWKQHARQALGRVRLLRHDPVVVSYNRWCVDRGYRAALAARLGLPFTDAGREEVPAVNGGSSFDGRRFDGRAGSMAVAERWRGYVDDPAYRRVLDEGVVALAEAVFGRSEASEALRPAGAAGAGVARLRTHGDPACDARGRARRAADGAGDRRAARGVGPGEVRAAGRPGRELPGLADAAGGR